MLTIRKAAVLGAGTMGSRIAAHLANTGVPAMLLDLDTARAAAGIEAARKHSPGGFFTDSALAMVRPGNFTDHLAEACQCDWVIEAVTENLQIKQDLWRRVSAFAGERTILSTNTSGIPLKSIAEAVNERAQPRFLGTHFFNPPRYLHLVELIPGPATSGALLDQVAEYCDRTLGKGVVRCKDTPNFIANRIGSFFGATVYKLMQEQDLTIEEVDALTGPLVGLPRSASFRLLDIVGLDVWAFVSGNLYGLVPEDPWRDRFQVPASMAAMIERGWLGEKSGQGFYKRVGPKKEIHAIDWKTLDYHPAQKPRLPGVDDALMIDDLRNRLSFLVNHPGKAGAFLRPLFTDVIAYATALAPQIAHDPLDIDRAMQWGYNHALGPFAIADAIPELRPPGGAIVAVPRGAEPPVVESNAGASLLDMGDGVLQLELHSKMNTLGPDIGRMVDAALAALERGFDALVVTGRGDTFSAGANLALVLSMAQEEDWDELDLLARQLQQSFMRLKYAPKPVVVAPHGKALGGGCELVLHGRGVQASAELYMGLVELGVGVIPGGGGCKEMILRLKDPRRVFELIGMARVSTSADNAKELGLLDKSAGVSMNPRRVKDDAKALALSLTRSYRAGVPRSDIKVGGDPACATLKMGAWLLREAGQISAHDFLIAGKLAHVITGGASPGERLVTEQHLLDLEREAFLSLCGTRETQERMAHMLKTGKPLRN